jgi:hypothetical protein
LIAIVAFVVTCNVVNAQVPVIIEKPTPYSFGFDVTDEFGTTLTRQEAGDGSGAVRGAYSYKDAQGLIRVVNYIADHLGYRANVDTNEPGTKTSAPASVAINANPIPVVAVAPKRLVVAQAPVVAAPYYVQNRRIYY